MASVAFGNRRARKSHLVKRRSGGGIGGEVADLRQDVDEAFEDIEGQLSLYKQTQVTKDVDSSEVIHTISIPPDNTASIGVRIHSHNAGKQILIREFTCVFKRAGSGAPVEIGAHDNGNQRDETEVVAWSTDYVVNAGNDGIDILGTGEAAVVVVWDVSSWTNLTSLV